MPNRGCRSLIFPEAPEMMVVFLLLEIKLIVLAVQTAVHAH